MKRTICHLLIICAVAGVILFTHLGSTRLWDRDEPRNAGCALEMMERGDLVVPMFNDELRAQKPALLYWLIISAYQVFGVTEFAARFWSAVLALGTVLATYGIGRRLFDPKVAFYSSIVLATSMMFIVAGRAATPDSVLIFCSTVALLIYVTGTFARKKLPSDPIQLKHEGHYFPQKYSSVLAMYAAMGVGVLAKGPVGFVVPCAIIGMFMLIQRLPPIEAEAWNRRGWFARLFVAVFRPFHPGHFFRTLWRMRPWTLAVTVLTVALPWYVLVGLQTDWDWPRQFLFTENLARATSTFENHRGGFWFYPLAILLGFFPWSVFLGPVLIGVDRQVTGQSRDSTACTLLLCWIGVQVGLFSLAQTKLPSYVTPCYPALALLTGSFLVRFTSGQANTSHRFHRLSLQCLIASGVIIAGGFGIAAAIYLSGDYRLSLIGLVPIFAGVFALHFHSRKKLAGAVYTCMAGAVVFAIGVFGLGSVAVDQHRQVDRLLAHISDRPERTPMATYGCLESSWVYYARQPIYELSPARQHHPWRDQRQQFWEKKQWPSPEQFFATHPNGVMITTNDRLQELHSRIPPDFEVLEEIPYFLRHKQLVLLGRPHSHDEPDRVAEQRGTKAR